MLKSMKKNKKYIFWMAAFGLAGLLLAPIVIYIIKVSKRYPKAFRWITAAAFAFICIYEFLFEQEQNSSFVLILCICTVMSIGKVLDTNNR